MHVAASDADDRTDRLRGRIEDAQDCARQVAARVQPHQRDARAGGRSGSTRRHLGGGCRRRRGHSLALVEHRPELLRRGLRRQPSRHMPKRPLSRLPRALSLVLETLGQTAPHLAVKLVRCRHVALEALDGDHWPVVVERQRAREVALPATHVHEQVALRLASHAVRRRAEVHDLVHLLRIDGTAQVDA